MSQKFTFYISEYTERQNGQWTKRRKYSIKVETVQARKLERWFNIFLNKPRLALKTYKTDTVHDYENQRKQIHEAVFDALGERENRTEYAKHWLTKDIEV